MYNVGSTIVAAVQFGPELFNVQKNLATATQLAFEAAAKGAKIIVLPELCISGFTLKNTREAMDCAQDRNGYQTEAFLVLAQKFNCYIVFGYVELLDGKLYNSAACVGPQGLEANFQKHNLWGSDNLWAQPSEQHCPIVVTPYGRLGALICRDVMNNYRKSYQFYKPSERFYKRGSVDILAIPTNWGSGFEYPETDWVELVEETRAHAIVANRVGKEDKMKFKGGSCIINNDRRIWTNGSSFTSDAIVGGIIEVK